MVGEADIQQANLTKQLRLWTSAVFNILAIEDGGFSSLCIFWPPNIFQIQDQTTIICYLNQNKIQNITTTFQLLLALIKFKLDLKALLPK